MKFDAEIVKLYQQWQKETGRCPEIHIADVELDLIGLDDVDFFNFTKGQNKYIQKYINSNPGDIPVLGSSLDNNCIAAYVTPIKESDIIREECVSFNKDNAKGSFVFYRDKPFVMDRHHLAIIPNRDKVDALYLEASLSPFFKHMGFGWGENIASFDAVKKARVAIPSAISESASSVFIQASIIEFIEWQKAKIQSYLQPLRELQNKLADFESLMLAKIFNLNKDEDIIKVFNRWVKQTDYELDFGDIEFEFRELGKGICDFPKLSNVKDIDITIKAFKALAVKDQNEYIPKITGTMEHNQIGGYVKKDRLKSLPNPTSPPCVISWARLNGRNFFIQTESVCTSDDSFVMSPKADFNIDFLYYSLVAASTDSDFDWSKKIGKTIMQMMKIIVPKEELSSTLIQRAIVEFIEDFMLWKRSLEFKIQRFKEQTQTYEELLLAKVFQGVVK